ncbi:hypothetical protein D3P04_05375 [Paracoccus onubensis]|uniref:Uncharacterized protein n=1 Tax=Paracoccus onubensis TaxID=1675788 RepID=A0A418T1V6_9RHOB|nr:hypothetical protein D3P04_05375 [Paracoccus onubensis]
MQEHFQPGTVVVVSKADNGAFWIKGINRDQIPLLLCPSQTLRPSYKNIRNFVAPEHPAHDQIRLLSQSCGNIFHPA